jgi:hypothetical protein
VPSFDDLRPYLVAISALSGPEYQPVHGTDLFAAVNEHEENISAAMFSNKLAVLRRGSLISLHVRGGGREPWSFVRIGLTTAGRQEVERWPSGAGLSATDFDALLTVFAACAEDESLPEEERGKVNAAVSALKSLGTGVGVAVLSEWAKRSTGLSG